MKTWRIGRVGWCKAASRMGELTMGPATMGEVAWNLGGGDLTGTGEGERWLSTDGFDSGGGGLSIRSCTALRAAKKSDGLGGNGERRATGECDGG